MTWQEGVHRLASTLDLTNHGKSLNEVLVQSKRARRTGKWPAWRRHKLPRDVVGHGWAGEFSSCCENGVFVVLIRPVATSWGVVEHAMISLAARDTSLTWAERQRIKDECFAPERLAVEVFPPRSELVDAADAYHLWVLPAGTKLPFTIYEAGHRRGEPLGSPPAHGTGAG